MMLAAIVGPMAFWQVDAMLVHCWQATDKTCTPTIASAIQIAA